MAILRTGIEFVGIIFALADLIYRQPILILLRHFYSDMRAGELLVVTLIGNVLREWRGKTRQSNQWNLTGCVLLKKPDKKESEWLF